MTKELVCPYGLKRPNGPRPWGLIKGEGEVRSVGWGLVAQEKGGQRGQGPLCPYSLVVIVRLVLPSYLIEVC